MQDSLAVLVQRVGFGEVTPTAEGPSFTPNQERSGPAFLRRVKALRDLAEHGGAQGVHLVGPVEDQLGDAVLDGQPDRCGACQIPAYGARSLAVRIFNWLAQTVTPFWLSTSHRYETSPDFASRSDFSMTSMSR